MDELESRIAHGVSPGPRPGGAVRTDVGSPYEMHDGETPDRRPDALPNAPSDPPIGPMVGDAIAYRGMMFAPTNEMGVVMLFGDAALDLGFMVEAARAGFPDCYAWRRVAPGRWKRVRIEFEYASTNFRIHEHNPKGCDLIVCWEHNWLKCPIEIFDLKKEIAKLRLKGLGLA